MTMPQLRDITFLWPLMLWLLLLLPVLVLVYLRLSRRSSAAARQLARLSSVQTSAGREPSAFGRHVSALLMLLAIALMIVAVARPVSYTHLTLPTKRIV